MLGIVWMGVRTPHHDALRMMLGDVMGMQVAKQDQDVTWFELPGGEGIQIYGASDSDHTFFGEGPTVGFLVDDFDEARATMLDAGIEFIGEPQTDGHRSWNHFRGPDGNIYEILG